MYEFIRSAVAIQVIATTAALLVFAMACLHGLTQSLTALVTEGAGLPLPRRPAAAGGGLPAGAAALPPATGLLALPGAGDHGAAGPVGLRCPQAPFLTGAEKARRPVVWHTDLPGPKGYTDNRDIQVWKRRPSSSRKRGRRRTMSRNTAATSPAAAAMTDQPG